MRLSDYLERHRMSGSEFAVRIGVSESTINRLIPRPGKKQLRRPSWDLIEKIAAATGGAVTADDFMTSGPTESRRTA